MSSDSLTGNLLPPHFSALLQTAGVAVIGITPGGKVTVWNGQAESLFGFSADEIVGKPISQLIPSNQVKQDREIVEALQHADLIEDVVTQRIHRNGDSVDVYLTYAAVRDPASGLCGVLVIARNLQETKRVENAERDQLFLSAIVSSADDAIISKDLQGIVTSWNKSAETMFGYTAEEIIGRPISTIIPADHPREEPQILARIRRGERIAHYETQRVRKDGRRIDVALTVSPIRDRFGRVIGASKIVRDISEHKRWQEAQAAQSFLGALVESADDAIISKTLDG
ncbi:MAG TPA: PAS domain S-box protein, partial [Terriglobia bacterium]|nr:PAS domain S-box protein [Terriglobia bacterium]